MSEKYSGLPDDAFGVGIGGPAESVEKDRLRSLLKTGAVAEGLRSLYALARGKVAEGPVLLLVPSSPAEIQSFVRGSLPQIDIVIKEKRENDFKDEEKKQSLAKICNSQMWIAEAPVVIVACGRNLNFNRAGYMGDMSVLVDTSIAFTHLILASRNEGLGTCWIGAFDNEKVKKLLKVPEKWYVVAITPIGYPKKGEKAFKEPNERKTKEEIISTDIF